MLFNIYMKLLGEIIKSFGVRCHLYADDVQLCHSFPPVTKEGCSGPEPVLGRCVRLDEGQEIETESRQDRGPPGQSEGQTGYRVTACAGWGHTHSLQVRSLWVILDSSLSLEPQVSAVARGAFAQLKLVRQLRPYLGKPDLATVVHALVTSCLDYCNTLYVGLPLKTVRKLQLVQREAARLITGAAFRERTTPLLRQLHWLPISYRAQFKVLALAYKALNGSGPAYLSERVSRYDPPRSLRSSDEALLTVLSASQVRLAGTRDRAFLVMAPHLWNALPIEVRHAPSLLSFRRKVKTWLWGQAFE
ncbi:uncharacterized protein LOC134297776 [Anolis carolinensis]|uniref:uncharacterized protein LOC134297776 n=1 Tax=Anolis carolinensis TaxID=28377 RepID=UPI002F2B5A11